MFKRYTFKHENRVRISNKQTGQTECLKNELDFWDVKTEDLPDAINRLAAYEDLGLEPEEMAKTLVTFKQLNNLFELQCESAANAIRALNEMLVSYSTSINSLAFAKDSTVAQLEAEIAELKQAHLPD